MFDNSSEKTSDEKNVTDYLKDVPEKRKAAFALWGNSGNVSYYFYYA